MRDHAWAAPAGGPQVRPASAVPHWARVQSELPPVRNAFVADEGRARSTRPGDLRRSQVTPASSVTHTLPGFAHVPAVTTQAPRGPTAETSCSTGTTSSAFV